ncbi:NUDIX hydrolase [Marinomonas posidonica IVIA-Po-181]|uniref:Phosphatase NudJ n=1 Tax=Marinomonas posidonica (strain CECT 7376 / NCIMB 14433 / IVIA-Po-181) TaxID=491952 RepID=F6CTH0_MARPP|nr:NUDIX hydrolase [Marinomonas posidonica IVIA-Po-181]
MNNKERNRLPHLTVAALVQKDQKYLIVKEWQDNQIVLNQPAGHVENNEDVLQAVIRETQEESGWLVEPIGLVGLYAFTPYKGADTYHRLCILCRPVQHISDQLDDDILSSHWLSWDEIQSFPHRSPLINACIEDSQNKPTMPLAFLSNQFLIPENR